MLGYPPTPPPPRRSRWLTARPAYLLGLGQRRGRVPSQGGGVYKLDMVQHPSGSPPARQPPPWSLFRRLLFLGLHGPIPCYCFKEGHMNGEVGAPILQPMPAFGTMILLTSHLAPHGCCTAVTHFCCGPDVDACPTLFETLHFTRAQRSGCSGWGSTTLCCHPRNHLAEAVRSKPGRRILGKTPHTPHFGPFWGYSRTKGLNRLFNPL